jgi:hypothetical protein
LQRKWMDDAQEASGVRRMRIGFPALVPRRDTKNVTQRHQESQSEPVLRSLNATAGRICAMM